MRFILSFFLFGALNLIDTFIIIRFQRRIYGNIKFSIIKFRLLVVFIYGLTTFSMVDMPYLMLWGLVFLSSIWSVAYQPNKKVKILFQLVLISLALLSLVITFVLASVLTKNITSIGIALVFFPHILFGILAEICFRLYKSASIKLPLHMWILLFTIPLASVICVTALTKILDVVKNDLAIVHKLQLPILLAILFINVMVFYLFDKFSALLNSKVEKTLLKQQIEMQAKFYQSMEQNQQRIRSLQHDMKNHIRAITDLYGNGHHEELHTYLREINGSYEKADRIIVTGNKAIDTVLNIKISECKANLIQVHASILIPKDLKISFEQSVVLLGNLLDNAMEACMPLPVTERNVTIQMRYTDNILFINVSNSFNKAEKVPLLQSKKEDTFLHGIGLKNVEQVVDLFHGTMKLSSTSDLFKVSIVLYGV